MNLLNSLKNIRIRTKLISSFTILLLFMGVIGYSGYNSLNKVMDNLEKIFSVRLSIDYLIQADRDLQQLLVAERSLVYADVKSDIFNTLVSEYEQNLKQYQERWEHFKALPASAEEATIIPLCDRTRREWESLSRQIVDGRIANIPGERWMVAALSLGQARDKFLEMRSHIDRLTDLNLTSADQAQENAAKSFQRAIVILVTTLTAAIVLGIFMAWLISHYITGTVNAAVVGLKNIAQGEGDLTMRLQETSRDEVGELAKWFNIFIQKLQSIIKDIAGDVETISSSSIKLSAISEQMTQGITTVSDKSNTVAVAAEEMKSNMNTVAAAMEQSASNTSMVASDTGRMSGAIEKIAESTEKARSISGEASHKASSASANIDQLGEAAQEIGKVVEAITDISEQVNLLALNATIEAARAGEAGKGFAVVANEIKELANQTASATGDIGEKIEGIQVITATTVGQIGEITQVITHVNDVVSTIATAVEEQSASTKNIVTKVTHASQGIQAVNENVNQSSSVSAEISRDIADVSVSMNEMSISSSQVNLSSQELSKLSEHLKQMVDQFKV